MSIALIMGRNDAERKRRQQRNEGWLQALRKCAPDTAIELWPNISDPNAVDYAIAWDQPKGVFQHFPHLRCISSIGSGVNHLIDDESIAQHIPIVRIVDDKLSRDMCHYVLQSVLNVTRMQKFFQEGQEKKEWRQFSPFNLTDHKTIGVMGLGEIGGLIAETLASIGMNVLGWSRRLKKMSHVRCYAENDFNVFLAHTDILVCILPLNKHTNGIINTNSLKKLPQGAFVINIARGQHVVDHDLIDAIDSGHISGAKLDVFHHEPLPSDHPFWTHPYIEITPHNAGVTTAKKCAQQIIDNYIRLKNGEPLKNCIDKLAGY